MKQFEFVISKGTAKHHVFATAKNADIAFDAVLNAYGREFEISLTPCETYRPHYFYGEIDASAIS